MWISPVVENSYRGYHGYWATDLFKVNGHFGSKKDLKKLSKSLKSRGMYLMLDVVANHMAPAPQVEPDTTWNFSHPQATPEYLKNITTFPKKEHFHDYCPIRNVSNSTDAEMCWLYNLADLNHENEAVVSELLNWVRWLVKTFQVDGLRIDTCLYVPHWFWTKFSEAAGVYTVCEVTAST